jgi:hypothetical protein
VKITNVQGGGGVVWRLDLSRGYQMHQMQGALVSLMLPYLFYDGAEEHELLSAHSLRCTRTISHSIFLGLCLPVRHILIFWETFNHVVLILIVDDIRRYLLLSPLDGGVADEASPLSPPTFRTKCGRELQ